MLHNVIFISRCLPTRRTVAWCEAYNRPGEALSGISECLVSYWPRSSCRSMPAPRMGVQLRPHLVLRRGPRPTRGPGQPRLRQHQRMPSPAPLLSAMAVLHRRRLPIRPRQWPCHSPMSALALDTKVLHAQRQGRGLRSRHTGDRCQTAPIIRPVPGLRLTIYVRPAVSPWLQ